MIQYTPTNRAHCQQRLATAPPRAASTSRLMITMRQLSIIGQRSHVEDKPGFLSADSAGLVLSGYRAKVKGQRPKGKGHIRQTWSSLSWYCWTTVLNFSVMLMLSSRSLVFFSLFCWSKVDISARVVWNLAWVSLRRSSSSRILWRDSSWKYSNNLLYE